MTAHADTILTVDLGAMVDNYAMLRKKAPGSQCAAVVKANAYGLGVAKVAPALKDAGCEVFFVATLDEGIELRAVLGDAQIFVFHGVRAGQEGLFCEYSLSPVLNSLLQISLWSKYPDKTQKKDSIIHVDTGMNRLGISLGQWRGVLAEKEMFDALKMRYLMSHLACADEAEHPLNAKQLHDFRQALALAPSLKATLANSYGVFLGKEYHFDMLRPGCALYGVNPLPEKENPMKSVISLKSKIVQIREIDSIQSVGYGASCVVPKGSRLATLPVGYADGYLRSLGNEGFCAVNGVKLPIVGRVSMDLIVVDISQLPEGSVLPGDEVELLGRTITVNDVAGWAGTIGYEILTGLGRRYERVYI